MAPGGPVGAWRSSGYLDVPPPVAVAHRGGATDGAENSLAAFRRAVELGYRYLETDVHTTADGVLVAFHDDTLDRVTDRRGAIGELPWSEVAAARIAGREPIPRLTELLDAVPDVRVSIDPKSDAAVEPLVRVLAARSDAERVCVASFEQARLRRVRAALPQVTTAAGPWEVRALRAAAWGLLPRAVLRPTYDLVSVPERDGRTRIVDRAFVRLCHELGLDIHVWTVNDRIDMHRMLNLGVDGLVTDEVEALREVLRERGRWTQPGQDDDASSSPSR